MRQRTVDQLTAGDMMTTSLVAVAPADTLRDAMAVLVRCHVSGAPVVDGDGRCVGVLSTTDILRVEKQYGAESNEANTSAVQIFDAELNRWEGIQLAPAALEPIAEIRVRDVMSPLPVAIGSSASLVDVAKSMYDQHVHRVLVVDDDAKLQGIISTFDFVRVLATTPLLSNARQKRRSKQRQPPTRRAHRLIRKKTPTAKGKVAKRRPKSRRNR